MPDCRQNKNFPQKMDSATFACLLKSNLMQKMKKKTKLNELILIRQC